MSADDFSGIFADLAAAAFLGGAIGVAIGDNYSRSYANLARVVVYIVAWALLKTVSP